MGVDPTHPLTLALTLALTLTLTLTPTLTPIRTRNERETRLRRLWKFIHYSDLRTTA